MELNNNAEEGRTAEARRIYANLLEQTLAQEMSIVNSLRQVCFRTKFSSNVTESIVCLSFPLTVGPKRARTQHGV